MFTSMQTNLVFTTKNGRIPAILPSEDFTIFTFTMRTISSPKTRLCEMYKSVNKKHGKLFQEQYCSSSLSTFFFFDANPLIKKSLWRKTKGSKNINPITEGILFLYPLEGWFNSMLFALKKQDTESVSLHFFQNIFAVIDEYTASYALHTTKPSCEASHV